MGTSGCKLFEGYFERFGLLASGRLMIFLILIESYLLPKNFYLKEISKAKQIDVINCLV